MVVVSKLLTLGFTGKRKRDEDAEKKAKISNGISKYFNNTQSTVTAPKPKVGIPTD